MRHQFDRMQRDADVDLHGEIGFSNNGFCCIAGSVAQANTCPPTWMVNGGATCSATECANSFYDVCTSSSECPTSRPTCTAVLIQGLSYYTGLCL